jgi:hypothetical protein
MGRAFAVSVLCAALLAAPVGASESTIYPGVGIGKIKLGMTLAQVERVLGTDKLVDARGTVAGTRYVEYGWAFSTWSVGFLQTGRTLHAVQIETTVSGQRTSGGIGVSSPFVRTARQYPNALCTGIVTSWTGTEYEFHGEWAIVVVTPGAYTAFAVKPATTDEYNGPWRVYAVIVQKAVLGHISFARVRYDNGKVKTEGCTDGWRDRGTPAQFP